METLTREIANEYRKRAMLLPANGLQDIGKRRELRKELQARCDLTELQAVNIINGFHIPDYVKIAAIKAEKEAKRKDRSRPVSEMLLMMFRSAARDRKKVLSDGC